MDRVQLTLLLEWMYKNQYAALDEIIGVGGLDVLDMETIVDGFVESQVDGWIKRESA